MSFNPSEPRIPAGQGGGGRWGGGGSGSKKNSPRDAAAAKAQANPKAAPLFDKATGLPPAQRAKYVQGLSDSDLELLTQALYSARTSDPTIVQSRIAAANEMSKRGIDIKKYGAQGGSSTAKKGVPAGKVSPAQHKAVAQVQARKAAAAGGPSAASQAATTARQASQVRSATSVRAQ